MPPAGFEPAAFCSQDPQHLCIANETSQLADVLPFPVNQSRKSLNDATKDPRLPKTPDSQLGRLIKICP